MGILNLLRKLKVYIAAVAGFIAAATAIYFSGKRSGKTEEHVKHVEKAVEDAKAEAVIAVAIQKAEAEREVESVENANEVLHETARMSDDAVTDKLRNKWQRD